MSIDKRSRDSLIDFAILFYSCELICIYIYKFTHRYRNFEHVIGQLDN